MKFEDTSQNLRSRLWMVQSFIILLLALLGVRLYYLQLVRGQYYAELAQNQRIRLLPIPAPRGDILANDGKTALANSSPIYNVILSREDLRDRELNSLAKPLAEALGVDPELLLDRFRQIGSQPAFESILVKQDAQPGDIAQNGNFAVGLRFLVLHQAANDDSLCIRSHHHGIRRAHVDDWRIHPKRNGNRLGRKLRDLRRNDHLHHVICGDERRDPENNSDRLISDGVDRRAGESIEACAGD